MANNERAEESIPLKACHIMLKELKVLEKKKGPADAQGRCQ